MQAILITTLLLLLLSVPFVAPALALTMENERYRLEVPDILGEQVQTPLPKLVTLKDNPTIIRRQAPLPFTFTLSSLLVDFGIITPTDPVTRTTNIIVKRGEGTGYTILAYQNHPLSNRESPYFIPDTMCDSSSCSETSPSAWVNPLVFGAGFRLDNVQGGASALGIDEKESLFLQFSDFSSSESARLIMSSMNKNSAKSNDESRITYKVNTPQTQKEGVYQNIIHYVAIPNF